MLNRNTKDRTRWHLQVTEKVNNGTAWVDSVLEERDVYPKYDECTREWSKESDEMYFEDKLNVDLKFVGDDYDFILFNGDGSDRPLNYKYILQLYYDNILVKTTYFRKTTCTVDADNRMVTVEMKNIGIYDNLENGMSDEYNVAKMDLTKHTTEYLMSPMVQLYKLNAEQVVSFCSLGAVATSDVIEEVSTIDDVVSKGMYAGYVFQGEVTSNATYNGNYYGTCNDYFNAAFYKEGASSGYHISFARMLINGYLIAIIGLSDSNNNLLYYRAINDIINDLYSDNGTVITLDPYGTSRQGEDPITLNNARIIRLGIRMLYHNGTSELSDNFITSSVYNEKIVLPLGTSQCPLVALVTEPSEYKYVPFYEELWIGNVKIYVNTNALNELIHSGTETIAQHYGTQDTILDCYKLTDVIKAVINKVDGSLIFEPNASHSQFFCNTTNPVSGLVNTQYYITQKSNLLTVNADYGAWKAPIELQHLIELLHYAFNCYYDIYEDANGNRHFRIEHKSFYLNGNSYTTSDQNNIDLTSYVDARNGKPLSHETAHWEYDTSDAPTKLEFSWMDDQSEAFSGEAIEVPENRMIINTNYTMKCNISWFSSDIDYLMLTAGSVSQDGFLIVGATEQSDGTIVIDNGVVQWGDQSANLLNYTLSFPYLHDKYWKSGICGTYAKINGVEVQIDNPPKMRTNEVTFVLPIGETIGTNQTITTSVGKGSVENVTFDLSSGKVTAKLKYDTK